MPASQFGLRHPSFSSSTAAAARSGSGDGRKRALEARLVPRSVAVAAGQQRAWGGGKVTAYEGRKKRGREEGRRCSDSEESSSSSSAAAGAAKKVTPSASSSEDEKERSSFHEEIRELVRCAAPRIGEKRDKFEAHFDDAWISNLLAKHRANPSGAVESFKRSLEARFPAPAKKKQRCDRCDGSHEASKCPYFNKERDDHPDASSASKRLAMAGDGGNAYLRQARVVPQPGDGSCLFHSLAYSYAALFDRDVGDARQLRAVLMDWLVEHEDARIADTPVRDWVKWDSGSSVSAYAKRMRHVGWGGGIEMAAFAHKFRVDVHVYERHISARFPFKRISRFEQRHLANRPSPAKPLTLLYRGGVHYDAILPDAPPVELPASPDPPPKLLEHPAAAAAAWPHAAAANRPATPRNRPAPPSTPSPRRDAPTVWRSSLTFPQNQPSPRY